MELTVFLLPASEMLQTPSEKLDDDDDDDDNTGSSDQTTAKVKGQLVRNWPTRSVGQSWVFR